MTRMAQTVTMAVFDQTRAQLDETATLWTSLTEDKSLGVSGANDQVMVRGRPKHVVGYLKEFLFSESQARGPVSALSGGERARLLLAKIMARESNLLVLDEPTNDLDVETLDLLVELLSDYDGTLLLVSHDRDFVDRVATSTIVMEGDGRAVEYAGGWSDYRAQLKLQQEESAAEAAAAKPKGAAGPVESAGADRLGGAKKLSYKQQRRLDELPAEMDRLTAEIAKLEEFLGQPDLYSKEPKKFAQATQLLTEKQQKLAAGEEEWLELEELREALGG